MSAVVWCLAGGGVTWFADSQFMLCLVWGFRASDVGMYSACVLVPISSEPVRLASVTRIYSWTFRPQPAPAALLLPSLNPSPSAPSTAAACLPLAHRTLMNTAAGPCRDRLYLRRNTGRSRANTADEDPLLLDVFAHVAINNGLECKVACSNSKVCVLRGEEG